MDVNKIKELYPAGTRIVLLSMGDDPRPIPPGTKGTVDYVDDIGQLHCSFDNGRYLGIIPGEDEFKKVYSSDDISLNLREDGKLEIYLKNCLAAEISDGKYSLEFALEVLTGMGYYFDDEIKPSNKITVLVIEPGKIARVEEVETGLKSYQKLVGGDIEGYYPFEEAVCIVCDDSGKFDGSLPNRAVYDSDGRMLDIIFGTFFICDCSGEDFGSLSPSQIDKYKKMFFYPERFFAADGKVQAVKIQTKEDSK